MAFVALLYAHHRGAHADGEPIAALSVTGISSVRRQIRQSVRAGAERVIVVVEKMTPGIAGALERARQDHKALQVVHGAQTVHEMIKDDDVVLTIDEGLVADARAIEAVAKASGAGAAIAVWADEHAAPIDGERIAENRIFAGIARFPGQLVRTVSRDIGDWDLQSTLLRSALGEGSVIEINAAEIATYDPARRREVALCWVRVVDKESAKKATDIAILDAQKGVLDWPARFIHPPVENLLTRLVLPTPLTPNMISVGVFLIGLVAMACFATGWLWTGLVLALIAGPLDGVDGKLARARVEFSKWGDLEHVADKIVEYGWFLALAHYFSTTGHPGAWALAAIIILFALAEAVQGEFFRRFTGQQIDDAGKFERQFRLVAGRRNTFFWSLIPFAFAGAWHAGLVMIAAYSAVTFFVMQMRFFKRIGEYGEQHSEKIAANFAKTAYAFLPEREASSS